MRIFIQKAFFCGYCILATEIFEAKDLNTLTDQNWVSAFSDGIFPENPKQFAVSGKPAFWMYVGDWLQSGDMWLGSKFLSEYGAPRSKYNSNSNLIVARLHNLYLRHLEFHQSIWENIRTMRYLKSRVVVVQINNQWRPDNNDQDAFSQSFLRLFPISVHLLLRQL